MRTLNLIRLVKWSLQGFCVCAGWSNVHLLETNTRVNSQGEYHLLSCSRLCTCIVALQLVDELSKVRTMLYDGDVASLLPAKPNGEHEALFSGRHWGALNWMPKLPIMMVFDMVIGMVLNCCNVHAAGFFLRVLLGPANVRATRKDGRYKVKEEYNAYRVGLLTNTAEGAWLSWSQS
jgi:hypothetical protein